MRKIRVKLGKRSYQIIIGNNILKQLGNYLTKLNIGSHAFIITNSFLKNKYGLALSRALTKSGFGCHFKIVEDSEKSKSIKTASSVINELARFDRARKVFIIAFGGGVIGDLSGFVASVYKRGISYVQVPTTLLAQVDSAIGGKTAIDLELGKNLVGAFYQPRLVFSEINFLKSLNRRQLSTAMAEIIKYAAIKDKKFFNFLENNYKKIIKLDPAALETIIGTCSSIKAKIVSNDEKEALGKRTILNFGHTIGHAIEAASGYKKYNHGEAISLGMIAALELSRKLKLIDLKSFRRIENLLKTYALPVKLKGVAVNKIVDAHYRDKKFLGRENKFVLLSCIGRTKIVRKINLSLIKKAIKKLN